MHVEHPITTTRANALASELERETQAVRALNDAMALVCEQLLGGRHPPPDPQPGV